MKSIKRLPSSIQRTLGEGLLGGQRDITRGNAFCEAARPALEEAQGALVAALAQEELSAELAAVSEALRDDDARHDRLVALISAGLEAGIALAEHRGEGDDARLLQACLDTLLPDGRAQSAKPWHEEAGQAATFVARLSPAQVARLETLLTAGAPTMGLVREWVASAQALGGLLTRRAALGATAGAQVDLRDVRGPWGSRFGAFLDGLPVSGLSPEAQQQLRAPFEEAVRMHSARLRARRAASAPTPLAEAAPAVESQPANGVGM